MRSSGLDPVDLMKIAEEVESFGPLSALAKKLGVSNQWVAGPVKIEGLKQENTSRQMPAEVFQCSYGL